MSESESDLDVDLDILENVTAGFRDADGCIIQPSDGRKTWDEPTPLDGFVGDCLKHCDRGVEDWQILQGFFKIAERDPLPDEFLKEVPSGGTIAQFEANRGKTCLLVLGNCPQYNVGMPVFRPSTEESELVTSPRSAFTIHVLKALAEECPTIGTIGLDVRKSCRKYHCEHPRKDYSPCRAITPPELRRLLWATKLEMIIAAKQYDIKWKHCFAFSTYPCRIANLLGFKPGNVATNSFHIADCARPEILIYQKWKLAGMILKDITESLFRLRLSKSHEDLYNKLAAAIRKWNPDFKMPNFDLSEPTNTSETRTDLTIRQNELMLKITVYGTEENRKDLETCRSRLADLGAASNRLKRTTNSSDTRKPASSKKRNELPRGMITYLKSIQPPPQNTITQMPSRAGFRNDALPPHSRRNTSSEGLTVLPVAETTVRGSSSSVMQPSVDIPETEERYKWLYRADAQLDDATVAQWWSMPIHPLTKIVQYPEFPNKEQLLGPLMERLKLPLRTSGKNLDDFGYAELRSLCSVKEPKVIARYVPDHRGWEKITALHLAAYDGSEDILEELLQWAPVLGKDYVNARTLQQATPLHYTMYRASTAATIMLLNYGGDVNAVDEDNNSALDIAIAMRTRKLLPPRHGWKNRNTDQIRLLLKWGADHQGRTEALREILGAEYLDELLKTRATRAART